MLIKAKDLRGYSLLCLDGEIGKVEEFYFDDHHWTIRYLIAETGGWLTGWQVLISPYAMTTVNKEEQNISINLTKKQIEESPLLESDKPVSRQYEESYYGYYGWPLYWGGADMWGLSPYIESGLNSRTAGHTANNKNRSSDLHSKHSWDPNLRSTKAVSGYGIHAADGEIGHVDDFIIDDETWAIRYLVIDTQNWWPGKKILIAPSWISSISWEESKVVINLPRETIKLSPEYTDESLLTRDYENSLHMHYNRRGYWYKEQPDNQ